MTDWFRMIPEGVSQRHPSGISSEISVRESQTMRKIPCGSGMRISPDSGRWLAGWALQA